MFQGLQEYPTRHSDNHRHIAGEAITIYFGMYSRGTVNTQSTVIDAWRSLFERYEPGASTDGDSNGDEGV